MRTTPELYKYMHFVAITFASLYCQSGATYVGSMFDIKLQFQSDKSRTETPEGEQVVVQIELLKPKDQFVSYSCFTSLWIQYDVTTSNFNFLFFSRVFQCFSSTILLLNATWYVPVIKLSTPLDAVRLELT